MSYIAAGSLTVGAFGRMVDSNIWLVVTLPLKYKQAPIGSYGILQQTIQVPEAATPLPVIFKIRQIEPVGEGVLGGNGFPVFDKLEPRTTISTASVF